MRKAVSHRTDVTGGVGLDYGSDEEIGEKIIEKIKETDQT